MSIPRIIHYCWFGRNPKPALAQKCIKSWKKYCPDYEIIEWNEDNYDLSAAPLYVRQAYEAQKWAFVTDYIRLQVVYENGGIYLDTDVELKKNLDPLLCYNAYFGFESGAYIATGLGFGAVKGCAIIKELMADYDEIPFVLADGSFDKMTCPQRNTQVFLRHGLIQNDSKQILCDDVLILPTIYLCPISYGSGKMVKSDKTISIHWFVASWLTKEERKKHKEKVKLNREDYIMHIPNRMLMKLLGVKKYQRFKSIIKRVLSMTNNQSNKH